LETLVAAPWRAPTTGGCPARRISWECEEHGDQQKGRDQCPPASWGTAGAKCRGRLRWDIEAELAYAEDYFRRVEPLLARQFVTADRVSEASSKKRAAEAAVTEARRRLRAAEAAIAEARMKKRGADASVDQVRAARRAADAAIGQAEHERGRAQDLLAQFGELNARLQAARAAVYAAELDVGYCRVRAPFDGYVTNLNIAVGE
jgi:multidrug efflux system membrane fusion protein